jgi:hypothetical protein
MFNFRKLVVLGMLAALCGWGLIAASAAQTWTQSGPLARFSHSAVYDSGSGQMIMFGGQSSGSDLNDLWLGVTSSTQSVSFTGMTASGTPPSGRYGHVATYDPGSNRMTVFGGATGSPSPCANDLWLLDGANGKSGNPTWLTLTASGTAPSARQYHSAAYDAGSNTLIVFGGNNCSSTYYNDVWVLSHANGEGGTSAWTKLQPTGTTPSAREGASAVYDPGSNVLVVYGGDAGSSRFGDVWTLSHANGSGGTPAWSQLSPTGTAPAARTSHTASYDSASNKMTVFGGATASGTLGDVWILTNANGQSGTPAWIKFSFKGATPPPLAYHTAVYDSVGNAIYVFGGSSDLHKLGITDRAFTLTGATVTTGSHQFILGGPAVRYAHSSFYDPASNSLFIFAGQHSITLNFNDYWQNSGLIGGNNLNWKLLSLTGTAPVARYGHTGLYDSGTNRMMVFGGASGFPSPCLNDYWILNKANGVGGTPSWSAVTPSGTLPSARTLHASAYDSGSNTLIIFGGFDCNTGYFNDVWILKNANNSSTPSWSKLSPSGSAPGAREAASAVYDATTNSLIIYGGDAGSSSLLSDIWILSNANGTGGTASWSQLRISNRGPVGRSGHTATYDSTANVMTIFGGYSGRAVLSDAWTLSAANGHGGISSWTQLPSGPLRRYHTSIYDPGSLNMVTFGGATGLVAANPTYDTYTLSNAAK